MFIKRAAKLITALAACQLVGVVGSLFTTPSLPAWYAALRKPSFTPPDGVFAPVWITLFFLMGVAAFLIWDKGIGRKGVRTALIVFGVQLALNLAWSALFFGLRSPLLAFVEIVALWLAIAASILTFYRVSKPASFLLVPYLAWVSFAAVLNYAIVRLNF
ncbi:MAG: tryptophan-rich sensory protein [candidate division Zixibacteria bacterium]|nr:tryptophan-rich sensory protein [candidate division Zixibacteria bacterium]